MKKKIVALCLCVALAVVAIGGATLAYFTDTDEAKNTFTVGNVEIKLDETDIDNPQGDRVQENSYKLIPGVSYVKDPMVTVLQGSEDCYVRLKVTFNNASEAMAMCLAPGFDAEDYTESMMKLVLLAGNGMLGFNQISSYYWLGINPELGTLDMEKKANDTKYCIYDKEADTITYIYYYYNEFESTGIVHSADADVTLPVLFEKVMTPAAATSKQLAALEDFQINVVAEAIQTSDNFADADEAWAAFDAQK